MPQKALPNSDDTTGGWTIQPLYEKIRIAPNDQTMITSSLNPNNDRFVVKLQTLSWPKKGQQILRIRLKDDTGAGNCPVKVVLWDGSTAIAFRTFFPTSSFQFYQVVLSNGEIAGIRSYDKLQVAVTAGDYGISNPCSGANSVPTNLLVDVNATTVGGDPYSFTSLLLTYATTGWAGQAGWYTALQSFVGGTIAFGIYCDNLQWKFAVLCNGVFVPSPTLPIATYNPFSMSGGFGSATGCFMNLSYAVHQ